MSLTPQILLLEVKCVFLVPTDNSSRTALLTKPTSLRPVARTARGTQTYRTVKVRMEPTRCRHNAVKFMSDVSDYCHSGRFSLLSLCNTGCQHGQSIASTPDHNRIARSGNVSDLMQDPNQTWNTNLLQSQWMQTLESLSFHETSTVLCNLKFSLRRWGVSSIRIGLMAIEM